MKRFKIDGVLFSLQIYSDLNYIKDDINAVERYRTELYRAKERFSVKLRLVNNDPIARKAWALLTDKHGSDTICSPHYMLGQMGTQNQKADVKAQASSQALQNLDACSGSDLHSVAPSALAVARKRRVHSQVSDLKRSFASSNWYRE